MKKTLVSVALFFLSLNAFAQTSCSCYKTEAVDEVFYHVAGRMTVSFGGTTTPLSHGVEIAPKVNTPVAFKIVSAPLTKANCKNSYSITIVDETNAQVVYTANSDSGTEFKYMFPKCKQAYTVTIKVKAANKTGPTQIIPIKGQDCERVLVAIVYPTCQ
jgi:hypothetical protein